jgi:hypothetical protein
MNIEVTTQSGEMGVFCYFWGIADTPKITKKHPFPLVEQLVCLILPFLQRRNP